MTFARRCEDTRLASADSGLRREGPKTENPWKGGSESLVMVENLATGYEGRASYLCAWAFDAAPSSSWNVSFSIW